MTNDGDFSEIGSEFQSEFSRAVDVTSFGAKGRFFKFQATEAESRALAGRYLVLSVNDLDVECKITPARKGSYKLVATFRAIVVQSCGITLDPIEENIAGEFTLTLMLPSGQKIKENSEIDFNPDEEDIEFLESNLIDVGELVAQHLSLEINPYPRRIDAIGDELGQKIVQEEDVILEGEKKNPFEVLKSLKHKT